MDESKLEVKVGALLLAALVGVLTLLFLMGELHFTSRSSLTVDFSHTGNVVRGAPVKLGGVPVGKVEGIELHAARKDDSGDPMPVRMQLQIDKEALAALRADVGVTVSSQGPLGEPYLELIVGSATAPYDGKTPIRAIDAPRIDIVSNRLARFLEAASGLLEKDPEALQTLVHGISGLTRTVDSVMADNRDDVRAIAQELAAAAKDLRALSAAARVQLEPGGKALALLDDAASTAKLLKNDGPVISKQAQTALGGLAALSGDFTAEDGQKVKAALARLDTMSARADKLLQKLEAGDGTAGALIKDKQVYEDLRTLLSDLRAHPWKLLWKD